MFGLGWQELLIVLVIIMIIFGAGKLPSLFKDLGSGVKEFKAAAGDESLPTSSTTTTTGDVIDTAPKSTTQNVPPASDPSRI